ncbi:anti-anti-sigma factor [Mycolicibacterium litorale]|nr:anti-anti-sigma factor [Mycolicibacterium litorale]
MSTPLSVNTGRDAHGQLVVSAIGEIDASNVTDFAEAVAAASADCADALVVDLSAVDYLDSAAINALAPHAESLEIIANPILMRVLRVSGLSELAKVREAPPTDDR